MDKHFEISWLRIFAGKNCPIFEEPQCHYSDYVPKTSSFVTNDFRYSLNPTDMVWVFTYTHNQNKRKMESCISFGEEGR